ncbi:proline--tRNA ligase [Paenibacillus physcomitrellae]|uniref:Proline--tRNA ligase n=1 Tax=Paenibacillus physcomitrellae TaxID=1619311 RepID=A0ABQ1FWI7_9BACL|nr:proline--tRNA ligase [Paenibacillus physcomitrellae]GGA31328.1 proline--tRNA ligase [Paenibacillus physcomitrellae]
MRQDKLLVPTLREAPGDAEANSHKLLLRGGYIRQLAAGVYTYLPLGWRVLRKVSNIVREEMDRTGAQELLMPAMQPAELWQESGRYNVYGPELIRLKDRNDREFALGPTHEEVITTLVRNDVTSYRKLPMNLYQIQTKYRDERRPRFGLLRGREFMMKDAYSFDVNWEGLDKVYKDMYNAYSRIFTRVGLDFRAVEANAGSIGGEGENHEFMALADIGEDTIVSCTACDYAANLEKAEIGFTEVPRNDEGVPAFEKIHTPGTASIAQLSEALGVPANQLVKTMIYVADGKIVAVLIRGDHEVNELKLQDVLGFEDIRPAESEEVTAAGFVPGFASPVGLDVTVIADREVMNVASWIVGANEKDYHLKNVIPTRDVKITKVADVRNATEGDVCPRCGEPLQFHRGIEVGHVFKLGTKYSQALGATFLDQEGKSQTMIMGCYGIGISRILSAITEQRSDGGSMVWPVSIAPFHVHLIQISAKDEAQRQLAEQLYEQLQAAGIEVLYDDRDERAGVKFKDADLMGMPIRVTVGKQAGEGLVEFKNRAEDVSEVYTAEQVMAEVLRFVKP